MLPGEDVVAPAEVFDLFPHDRPVFPTIVEIYVHRCAAPHRDHSLLRIEESRAGLSDGRQTNTHMELQKDEENEGKGVAALKAGTETGDLNLFFGSRSVPR